MKPPSGADEPMWSHATRMLLLCLGMTTFLACSDRSLDQQAGSLSAEAPLLSYWNRIRWHMQLLPGQVYGLDQISAYPTEPAMTFLSAYLITGNRLYREAAERQLEFAHSLENDDRLLIIPQYPWVSRDYQARHIYNLAIAGELLNEQQFTDWADACAQAMIVHLSRASHLDRYGVQRFLFANTYDMVPPYLAGGVPVVSPNQNAGVGLAFTLLCHLSRSSHYLSPVARDIALAELHASAAYQTPEGEIALTEGSPLSRFDTNYGSYTVFLWLLSNEHWQDSTLFSAISLAARWLARSDLLVGETSGWEYPAPNYSTLNIGRARYPERWSRWLLYWKTSTLTSEERRAWADSSLSQVYRLSSSHLPSGATPFCYFQLMGVPETEYLPHP